MRAVLSSIVLAAALLAGTAAAQTAKSSAPLNQSLADRFPINLAPDAPATRLSSSRARNERLTFWDGTRDAGRWSR